MVDAVIFILNSCRKKQENGMRYMGFGSPAFEYMINVDNERSIIIH